MSISEKQKYLDASARLVRPDECRPLSDIKVVQLLKNGGFGIRRGTDLGSDFYNLDLEYIGTATMCSQDIMDMAESHGVVLVRKQRSKVRYIVADGGQFHTLLNMDRENKHERALQRKELRDSALRSNLREIVPTKPDALTFKMQGSAPEPYTVIFEREGINVTARCNCPGGRFKSVCKHRIALLSGDVTNLVSENLEEMPKLREMIQGSDVEDAYERFIAVISNRAPVRSTEYRGAVALLTEALNN